MTSPFATELLARVFAAGLPPRAVRDHHLGPLAYRAGHDEYRRDYVANSLLTERRARLIGEAVARLTDADIPVALIKGISYVGWLYDDPLLRPMHDVDIMVPPGRHRAARDVLAAAGFREHEKPHARSRLHHAIAVQRGNDVIDVHRSIAQPVRTRIDLDRVWRDSAACAERDDGARRLSPVDATLFHFIHLARTQLCSPAIHYLDGALLLARLSADDDRELRARARRWRVSRALAAGIAMTRALTEPAAPWPRRGLRGRVLADPGEVLSGGLPPRAVQLMRKLYFVDGPADAAGYLAVALAARARLLRD